MAFGLVGQDSTHWAQWTQRSLWMTSRNLLAASSTVVISMASAGQSRSQALQTMQSSGRRNGVPRNRGRLLEKVAEELGHKDR
jgi:hypothetical protein